MLWTDETHGFDERREVRVALPEGYADNDRLYPVLVCHDPQWTFGTVRDSALNLGLARLVPRVIVVGIGWDSNQLHDTLFRRAAAYTPVEGNFPERSIPRSEARPKSGGAARHQAWLTETVLPFLEDRYRIDPADRTFIGHSFSGLFGLHVLLTEPGLFRRYLLASPSVWWEDKAILAFEQRYAELHSDLAAKVYASVGSDEEEPGFFPMIQNLRIMEAALRSRNYPGLDLTVAELPNEIHYSTIPAAISGGLRHLFG